MSAILAFLTVLALGAGWWLARQGLFAKPWLQVDQAGAATAHTAAPEQSAARVGLGVFLAVVGSLFALLITAYLLRSEMADWRAMPLPWIVWPNSLALLGASLSLEWAMKGANRGDAGAARVGVLIASVAALLFLIGQFAGWRMLADAGYFVNSAPADSFFYLMTAAHALHIIGGMYVLGRTFDRIWRRESPERIRLSIELSATYWLFMLVVWGVLLMILSGWAGQFIALCGQILSQGGLP
jgi:cytochrome c oxidase subunit 3